MSNQNVNFGMLVSKLNISTSRQLIHNHAKAELRKCLVQPVANSNWLMGSFAIYYQENISSKHAQIITQVDFDLPSYQH